jgi:hypothetical protein
MDRYDVAPTTLVQCEDDPHVRDVESRWDQEEGQAVRTQQKESGIEFYRGMAWGTLLGVLAWAILFLVWWWVC